MKPRKIIGIIGVLIAGGLGIALVSSASQASGYPMN
jgi:hypothetical protein